MNKKTFSCSHYHSPLDIIAIKFKCCESYFPCYFCHQENADHVPQQWHENEFDKKVILCRRCGSEFTIHQYINNQHNRCLHCESPFNPGCKNHWHLYFKIQSSQP